MHESVSRYFGTFVTLEADLEREFEALLRESSTLAVRVAVGVLRNRQDAEEVAQEAFAKAYRSFSQLRDRNRFKAWLVRMTWRLAIDRWRADRRRRLREDAVARLASSETAEEIAGTNQRAERLWEAIDTLPEKLRMVTVLTAIYGHNIRDVATLLDLPEGTVKSRLHLARRDLAEKLQCLMKTR